jgi:hypothetical protein
MPKNSLITIALLALASTAFANDAYRIKNSDSIITQRHEDLLKLAQLHAQGRTSEVRAFYQKLLSANACTTTNPGDRPVEVSAYYTDGTVQIDFNGQHGYIAKEDLGERVTQDNQTASNQPTNEQLVQTASDQVTAGAYFVFVPLPCPSATEYAKAQSFMDQICLRAEQDHIKVVIVRSCYNQTNNLQQSQKSGWWWDEILSLPQRYKIFIDQGTVSIVDSYPNLPLEYTPQGFLYRDGKLEWNGQLNTADPSSVMTAAVRELSRN